MEQRTIEILSVLVSLCRSANFTCDADGARKITIAIQAAETLIEELKNPEDGAEDDTDE